MTNYLLRRLLLIPLTLFCILLINFVIINLAPGEPTSITDISETGEATKKERSSAADERYLQFRERYGLTLPVLVNFWPWLSYSTLLSEIERRTEKDMRVKIGDQARFAMPHLVEIMNNPSLPSATREAAMEFFVRGGTSQATLGGNLTAEERAENQWISNSNYFLRSQLGKKEEGILALTNWYEENKIKLGYLPSFWEKISLFFFETRFSRYFGRVLTLDFGTMRDDPNKKVIDEVTKRFKYSLTLSVIPMAITFFLCLFFGYWMARTHGGITDNGLNLTFLILYAIPIFVAAPFLIEEVALKSNFFPLSGFASPERVYANLTTWGKLKDIARHITLPVLAILYGSLAAQSRLARTAVLEVQRQEYVRTAKAKGLDQGTIAMRYIGRNAAITMVTAIASSLGIILGGSLIVETLFEIDGFGKFFYDAVVNRDYNVMMFSAIAGSFLTLMGYLAADISYTLLDPRVRLE